MSRNFGRWIMSARGLNLLLGIIVFLLLLALLFDVETSSGSVIKANINGNNINIAKTDPCLGFLPNGQIVEIIVLIIDNTKIAFVELAYSPGIYFSKLPVVNLRITPLEGWLSLNPRGNISNTSGDGDFTLVLMAELIGERNFDLSPEGDSSIRLLEANKPVEWIWNFDTIQETSVISDYHVYGVNVMASIQGVGIEDNNSGASILMARPTSQSNNFMDSMDFQLWSGEFGFPIGP